MSQKAEDAAENARKIRTQLQTVENARASRITRALGTLGALVMTAAAVYALPHFNHTRAVISHVALDDKATSPQQSKGTTGSGDDADSGGNASQLSTKRRNWWGSK
jgi:hypothetical protein